MVLRLPASRLAANVAKAAWTRSVSPPMRGLASPASDRMAMKGKPWSNPYPEDQFSVHPHNGFLPKDEPLERLPEEYKEMESLLNRMSVKTKDGSPGLLATGDFGAAVEAELPEYDLSKVTDQRTLSGKPIHSHSADPQPCTVTSLSSPVPTSSSPATSSTRSTAPTASAARPCPATLPSP